MDPTLFANIGLDIGLFALFALPGLASPDARKWIPVIAAAAAIDLLSLVSPYIFPGLDIPGSHWNWSGKIAELAAMLTVSAILIRSGAFKARDIGLTIHQAPGTTGAMLRVILPYFLLAAAYTALFYGNHKFPSDETLAYQATMPGLAEELAFRGVQLALFDRIFPARFHLFGAPIGYGAIATSIIFGLLHGLSLDQHFVPQFSTLDFCTAGTVGLVLAWVRARSGSLAMPVVVHNVTNLIFESVPLLT